MAANARVSNQNIEVAVVVPTNARVSNQNVEVAYLSNQARVSNQNIEVAVLPPIGGNARLSYQSLEVAVYDPDDPLANPSTNARLTEEFLEVGYREAPSDNSLRLTEAFAEIGYRDALVSGPVALTQAFAEIGYRDPFQQHFEIEFRLGLAGGIRGGEVDLRSGETTCAATDVLVLLDRSGSMASFLPAAKAALHALIDELEDSGTDSTLRIATFSHHFTDGFGLEGSAVQEVASGNNWTAIGAAVDGISSGGYGSPIGEAIYYADYIMGLAGPARQVVILITDGGWNLGRNPVDAAIELLTDHPDTLFYVLGTTAGFPDPVSAELGEIGSGYISAPDELSLTEELLLRASPCETPVPLTMPIVFSMGLGEIALVPRSGFDDCGTYLGPRECEIRVYDADGNRKHLDIDDWLDAIEWEIIERGGCGAASLALVVPWEELGFEGNERIDIYLFGRPAYRGWLRVDQKELGGSGERANPSMHGLVERLNGWEVSRKFAYGCPTDLSEVFEDIIEHAAPDGLVDALGDGLDFEIDIEPIGFTVKEFDAVGKSAAEAVNQLCDLAPGLAIWGGGFAETPDWRGRRNHLLYFRTRKTVVSRVYSVGDNVTAFVYPRDLTRIANAYRLKGGKAAQENLLPNGSWESLKPASEDAGNMLLNASFEDDDPLGNHWTLGGGATVKYAGHPTAYGSARTGKQWLELDTNGEYAYQDVVIIPGRKYEASCWARLEDGTPNSGVLRIQGLDAGNSVVADESVAFNTVASPGVPALGLLYNRYAVELDTALHPTVVTVRHRMESQGGSAANDGVLFDDPGLYEACGVAQEKWRAHPTGSAAIEELEWDAAGGRRNGLCVRLRCSGIGGSGDTGELYLLKADSPSVEPNERYTMSLFWHVDGAGGASDDALSFGVVHIKADGTQGAVEEVFVHGNPSAWTFASLDFMTASDTAKLQPFIRGRTTRDVWLDDGMLVKGEAASDVWNHQDAEIWWPADAFELLMRADNPDIEDLTAAAAASIATYGVRMPSGGVSVEGVTSYELALLHAKGYFNAHGVPEILGSLKVLGPRELLEQDGTVRIINLPRSRKPEELFPSQVNYAVSKSGGITLDARLGNDQSDAIDFLAIAELKGKQGL